MFLGVGLNGDMLDPEEVDAWLKDNNIKWPFNKDQITHFIMRFHK